MNTIQRIYERMHNLATKTNADITAETVRMLSESYDPSSSRHAREILMPAIILNIKGLYGGMYPPEIIKNSIKSAALSFLTSELKKLSILKEEERAPFLRDPQKYAGQLDRIDIKYADKHRDIESLHDVWTVMIVRHFSV